MKFIDKFFRPYAEYCLRTSFSEEELREVFRKELPSENDLFALVKAQFKVGKITLFRKHDPLKLFVDGTTRNSLRGVISITCEKAGYESETILHITIAPSDLRFLVWGMLCFSVGISVCGGWFRVWPMLGALVMPLFLFMVLAVCRSVAQDEVPKIRQTFESTLRGLERQYQKDGV